MLEKQEKDPMAGVNEPESGIRGGQRERDFSCLRSHFFLPKITQLISGIYSFIL